MEEIIIPLDGRSTKVTLQNIGISDLLLDQDNPRISFFRDNQLSSELNDIEMVFALTNKKPDAFQKLKDSIHNNKGIMNPIWVEPQNNHKYKIVEGNSRFVVYLQLSSEEPNENCWKSILCYLLPFEISEEQKNYIRLQSHLRGTTDWDAYEKAKYLYKLWDEEGWSINKLEKQTKMTTDQIKENIDAYRLMEEQYLPTHSDDPNEVGKFSYFVEYIKDKKLQRVMDQNNLKPSDFCSWVGDREKLPTGQDVRKLRDILENDDTQQVFFHRGFTAALQSLEQIKPHLVSTFYREIEIVIEKLKNISTQEIDEIINDDENGKRELIKELADWSNKVIAIIDGEKSNNGINKT